MASAWPPTDAMALMSAASPPAPLPPVRSSPVSRATLLAYVFLIVYASWFPFTGWHSNGLSPLTFLENTRMPRYWTGFDVGINVVGYIPLGAAMFNDRVSKVLKEQGGELAHGATYSGHPVCAAVALENIRILQDEKIVERAKAEVAPYLAQRWAELGEHRLVGQARIAGMVGALELVPDKKKRAFFPERGTVGPRCRDHALKHGLILRATWDAMLLSPPLIITRAQVDELFDKTWKALNDTAADLGM